MGDFFNSLLETSDTWFPIISFLVISILSLFILKKILDKSVSSASSMTLSFSWDFFKKLIIYVVITVVAVTILGSLFFYGNERYHIYQENGSQEEQDFGYLLR